MSYQVLARKWRPRTFQEMVGQEHVLRALINALDHQRLHHAYLFTGTRGVGKTTLARIFAKALNCEQGVGSTPCGRCAVCSEVDQGRFVDLIEVDAASRTRVEDTRDLLDNVQYLPARGRTKVYLIDEVHMLSNSSFNALLKTLEEPPDYVKFLLATTDPQRLPVTILSRCLQFNLKRITAERIAAHVQMILGRENIQFDESAPALIAAHADGSMRDALSLLDQAIAYGGGALRDGDVRTMLGTVNREHVYDVARALAAGDGMAVLTAVQTIVESAVDFGQVLDELMHLLHQIAVQHVAPGARAVTAASMADDPVAELAQRIAPEDVQLFYQIGALGKRDFALAPDPRVALEMTLLRMIAFRPQPPPGDTDSTAARAPAAQAAPVRAAPRAPAPAHVIAEPPPLLNAAAAAQTQTDPDAEVRSKIPPDSPAPHAAPGQTSVASSWPELVKTLALDGLVRQLALNCAPARFESDRIDLVLAPSHRSLLNPKSEDRLRIALEQRLGRAIVLQINLSGGVADTPAQQDVRRREERMKAAQQIIADDAVVRGIVETFNGRVLSESIVPLVE